MNPFSLTMEGTKIMAQQAPNNLLIVPLFDPVTSSVSCLLRCVLIIDWDMVECPLESAVCQLCVLLCCVGEVRVLCRRVPGAECRWEGTTGEFTSAELAVCV